MSMVEIWKEKTSSISRETAITEIRFLSYEKYQLNCGSGIV